VKLPSNYNHEILYKQNNTYDIVLVLEYNMNPIKKNKGSAIFIHVAKKNYKKTEGCIAIKKIELLKIIKNISKKTKVKISNRR
jgi:L,D-peptidoglycan transpeptidase YkuD (ErfK/YbiS/YcfS/YnhG family)